jgi:hypothetical protein
MCPFLDFPDVGLDAGHGLLGSAAQPAAASKAAPAMSAASQAATTPLTAMIAHASRQPRP